MPRCPRYSAMYTGTTTWYSLIYGLATRGVMGEPALAHAYQYLYPTFVVDSAD